MSLPKNVLTAKSLSKTPFLMLQSHPDDFKKLSQNMLSGVQTESILSKVYFHQKNIDLIQKQIITRVFRDTNGDYLIESQNIEDLQIVMRSIFLQHAEHLPNNIKNQIRKLNTLTVDSIVPDIISELRMHDSYIKRAFGPMELMDLPKNVSNAGLKTLPSVTNRI